MMLRKIAISRGRLAQGWRGGALSHRRITGRTVSGPCASRFARASADRFLLDHEKRTRSPAMPFVAGSDGNRSLGASPTIRFSEARRGRATLSPTASSSLNGENALDLRNFFAMLKAIGENAERESLRFRDRFVATRAVR